MQFKFIIVLLALCALTNGSRVETIEHHLARVLLQSKDAFQANPADALDCFLAYSAEINAHTETYQDTLVQCSAAYDDAATGIDADNADNRSGLTADAESGCQAFVACNDFTSALDFFTCYGTTANAASKTAYNMNTQANQYVKDVQLALATILNTKDTCDTGCKLTYEKDLDGSYNELQSCMLAPAAVETKAKAVETKAPHSKVMRQALRKH